MWSNDDLPPHVEPLVIAAGSEWETRVIDARRYHTWSQSSGTRRPGPSGAIHWHHTCGPIPSGPVNEVLDDLVAEATHARYGLPYNFVVVPGDDPRPIYLNDVDGMWPHTRGRNDQTAIALCGNYDALIPRPSEVALMWRLSHALMVMWGIDIIILGHRETSATACPGYHIYRALCQLRGD
jgi:hypothetical protein